MIIGLVGTGSIGTFLLQTINEENRLPGYRIGGVLARDFEKTKRIGRTYEAVPYESMDDFLDAPFDLIIEAATGEVVQQLLPRALRRKRDVIVTSIGAMADETFFDEMERMALRNDSVILLPSGAIGGLDAIRSAAALGTLERVTLTTRKPLEALPSEQQETHTLFEGTAREAIAQFPQNMNVAITLALAGVGPDRTYVLVIADADVDQNEHTIEAKGAFGTLEFRIQNAPMPSNPKTSYLAALSVLATLQSTEVALRIG